MNDHSRRSGGFTPGRVDVISMGCSKNLVDSERLLRRLRAKGYHSVHDSAEPCGEWVMVNTCGFIGDAKEESINLILQLSEAKAEGRIGHIAVMGCLSERYLAELEEEIGEVDLWYGKFNWNLFIDQLPDRSSQLPQEPHPWERDLTTPEWSAYLKISEGCNRFCAFCAIPLITGRHTSRPRQEILDEVRHLVAKGVKEFNIIAQDLSSYGLDLSGESQLAQLIDEMASIPGVEWIRLHYAYPADFPMEILDVMRRRPNVCNYLDIALQHIADPVLANMRRHIDKEGTLRLIEEIRRRVPGIRLRTTLMTGFPGEGEKEFAELLDFVRTVRFDRMGAFAYCEEEGTWGARHLTDSIPEEVKQQRLQQLMDLQEEIALELNTELIGSTVRVLIESNDPSDPDSTATGRTQWDSPEVDPEVIVSGCTARPGEFVDVHITGAQPFELLGHVVDSTQEDSRN
ncbi:MAG: 30S ribosomal protein S12 methylthiotransferase RimO [Muribaculaceae bacterium]|nr:30S ribosomal protein S12 methylthiotransferase RimO [Muribaculaceae bacterium]MDE7343069.1 30S ribosomal protein S12 methylthiotransferase RimO [Muribaculaceae bacterium]